MGWTALISMYDRWVNAAVQGKVSGVVLLDLSVAFDLVEPDLFLKKLGIYGIEKDFLHWIRSYLTGRQQAVWIDHILSGFETTDVGVPQGSNLGPLFFLVFFNDLPDTVECNVDNYADDTTLTEAARTVDETGVNLSRSCETVSTWMRSNRMKLNPEKTHILTIGTKERLNVIPHTVKVTMDDVQLEEGPEGSELLLGCQIQANMKWKSQVEVLTKKLRKRLTGIRNLKFILPFQLRKTVSEGLFNSVLVYCLPLFGGCEAGHLRDIQVLQNKAAQVVCHAPPRAHRAAMYDKLGWLTVSQLVYYHSLLTVFKIRKSGEPEYLARKLNHENRLQKIIIPNTGLSLAKRSFFYRAAQQWNLLPTSVRNINQVGTFKKELREWILKNIQRFND